MPRWGSMLIFGLSLGVGVGIWMTLLYIASAFLLRPLALAPFSVNEENGLFVLRGMVEANVISGIVVTPFYLILRSRYRMGWILTAVYCLPLVFFIWILDRVILGVRLNFFAMNFGLNEFQILPFIGAVVNSAIWCFTLKKYTEGYEG
jgi:hypothetical protein